MDNPMNKSQKQLLQFIGTYLKNKDLFFKRIESMKEEDSALKIKYKHKEQNIYAEIQMDDGTIGRIESDKHASIIALNTKHNLDFLIKNWEVFSKHAGLAIYFTNPYSRTEKMWTIMPHIHNKIADNQSLKLGLNTMSENVEETTVDEFRKIVEG